MKAQNVKTDETAINISPSGLTFRPVGCLFNVRSLTLTVVYCNETSAGRWDLSWTILMMKFGVTFCKISSAAVIMSKQICFGPMSQIWFGYNEMTQCFVVWGVGSLSVTEIITIWCDGDSNAILANKGRDMDSVEGKFPKLKWQNLLRITCLIRLVYKIIPVLLK